MTLDTELLPNFPTPTYRVADELGYVGVVFLDERIARWRGACANGCRSIDHDLSATATEATVRLHAHVLEEHDGR